MTLTPGTRVKVTGTMYGTFDGQTGTVTEPGPGTRKAIERNPGLAATIWVELDGWFDDPQAAEVPGFNEDELEVIPLHDVLTAAAKTERERREQAGGTWPSLEEFGSDTLRLNLPVTLRNRIHHDPFAGVTGDEHDPI